MSLPHEGISAAEAGVTYGKYEEDGDGTKSYHSDTDASGLNISWRATWRGEWGLSGLHASYVEDMVSYAKAAATASGAEEDGDKERPGCEIPPGEMHDRKAEHACIHGKAIC